MSFLGYVCSELTRGYTVGGEEKLFSEKQRRISRFMKAPRELEKVCALYQCRSKIIEHTTFVHILYHYYNCCPSIFLKRFILWSFDSVGCHGARSAVCALGFMYGCLHIHPVAMELRVFSTILEHLVTRCMAQYGAPYNGSPIQFPHDQLSETVVYVFTCSIHQGTAL